MKQLSDAGRKRLSEAARISSTKHGMKGTREYHSWRSMKQRCLCVNDPFYKRYGGRGIKVCLRWLNSFENFYTDMGPRPLGTGLERMNNDGDYTPSNCRWATIKEQQRNRSSNKMITIDEVTKTLVEWCEVAKISPRTVGTRLRLGWTERDAIFSPLVRKGNRGNTKK